MTQFKATVTDYTPSTVIRSKAGKMIEYWVLTVQAGGKEQQFKGFASQLKTDRNLARMLGAVQSGDSVEITVEKNGAGYDQLVSVVPATSSGPATPPGVSGSAGRPATISRDFETKEERQQRQELIVRQSSLSNALEFHSKDKQMNVVDIINTAKIFRDWVYGEDKNDSSDVNPIDSDIQSDTEWL